MGKNITRWLAVLAVLCLILAPSAALASSFEFTGGASVAGNMHSDAKVELDVDFNLKWQALSFDPTIFPTQLYFGMASFDMLTFLGGTLPANFSTGVAYSAGNAAGAQEGVVAYSLISSTGSPINSYYPDTGSGTATTYTTGFFKLSTLTFYDNQLTLQGSLDTNWVLGSAPQSVQEILGSIPLSITVYRISNNDSGGQNSFFEKFRDFAAGGAGTVNFDLAKGGGGDSAVPEPGTMLLFGSAAGVMGWWRRRKGQA